MMGSSTSSLIPDIMQLIWEIKPTSVLDVGSGSGKWGFLIREKSDLCRNIPKSKFGIIIDSVEIDIRWNNIINDYIYDKLYVTDALNFINTREYELVMIGDLLEHMEKDKGHELIRNYNKICRYMIVSSPFGVVPNVQSHKWLDNYPYEKHKSGWTYKDFETDYRIIKADVKLPNFYVLLKGDLDEVKLS